MVGIRAGSTLKVTDIVWTWLYLLSLLGTLLASTLPGTQSRRPPPPSLKSNNIGKEEGGWLRRSQDKEENEDNIQQKSEPQSPVQQELRVEGEHVQTCSVGQ